jgi:hypothetical protein
MQLDGTVTRRFKRDLLGATATATNPLTEPLRLSLHAADEHNPSSTARIRREHQPHLL